MESQTQEWRPGVAVEDRELRTLVRRMNLAEVDARLYDRAVGNADARAFRRTKRLARYKRNQNQVGEILFSASGVYGARSIIYTDTGMGGFWTPLNIQEFNNFFIGMDTAT